MWSKWGGSSVRRPICSSLGNLVCPSGPGLSLARLESDVSSHCSWSWTPSTPTRPAGSAETSMASPSSTSSSPTVSPGARAPLPAACSSSVLPGSLPSRVPSQRSQSSHPHAHADPHTRGPACTRTYTTHVCTDSGMPQHTLSAGQPPLSPPVLSARHTPSSEIEDLPPSRPCLCFLVLETLPSSGLLYDPHPLQPRSQGPHCQAHEAPRRAHT